MRQNNNIFLKSVVLFLILLVLSGGTAYAQPTDRPQGASTECRVRANISEQETFDITGGEVSRSIARGEVLSLEGPAAGSSAIICAYSLIVFVATLLFTVILALAVLFVLVAAFYFITSGGNEEKTQKARSYVIYAIAGVIVAALAFVIPAIARTVLGV